MAKWTVDAFDDVRHAWDYIAADNEPAADRVIERITAVAELLDAHPLIGRVGKEPETREFVVSGTPYVVIYRLAGDEPEILRGLHGKQSWPPRG